MTTVERMLDASKDIWQSYNEHPFVLGIQNGTLDTEKFRYYIVQDYLYLEDYAKCFAIGVAKDNLVLIDKMNQLSAHYTEKQIQHLVDIFVSCSLYELKFWEMSWAQK